MEGPRLTWQAYPYKQKMIPNSGIKREVAIKLLNVLLCGASAVVFLSLPATACAQAELAAAGNADGGIVVTGTRMNSAATAPTPVLATRAEQVQNGSPKHITDALNQLPAFRSSSTGTSNPTSPARGNGSSFLNLRGLGKERALVLLDGRRFVAPNVSAVPHVNPIRQDPVQRVEVVTGGASATYGSNAVAGVVNIILAKKFTGVRASAQAGVSGCGDGALGKLTLIAGRRSGDRANIVASFEYLNQDPIGIGASPEAMRE